MNAIRPKKGLWHHRAGLEGETSVFPTVRIKKLIQTTSVFMPVEVDEDGLNTASVFTLNLFELLNPFSRTMQYLSQLCIILRLPGNVSKTCTHNVPGCLPFLMGMVKNLIFGST